MKSLDNELEALSDELERLDYVVVRQGAWVCVRLPLISSVRIHHTADGRFRLVPQIGPFRRSVGLFFTSGVSAAAVIASAIAYSTAPLTLILAFLGAMALAHDACRFVLTEGCITRLQQLIASRTGARPSLMTGQRAALADSAQYTFIDQRAIDQMPVSQ